VGRAGVVVMMCDGGEGEDGLEQRELIRLRTTGDGSHHSKDEATTRNGDDGGLLHTTLPATHISYSTGTGMIDGPSHHTMSYSYDMIPLNFPTLFTIAPRCPYNISISPATRDCRRTSPYYRS